MRHLMAILSVLISGLIYSGQTFGQNLDAINILSSCGNDCWTKDANNKSPDQIKVEPQAFDEAVVGCMQSCFSTKTKKSVIKSKLPSHQMIKIKVSSFCGHICFNNNKNSKKSLDYCYAGCLGTILQPKLKNKPQKKP